MNDTKVDIIVDVTIFFFHTIDLSTLRLVGLSLHSYDHLEWQKFIN